MHKDDIKKEIAKLREKIRRHDNLYYVLDRPNISDQEYDRLYKSLKEFEDAILLPDELILQSERFLKNAQEIIDGTEDFNILEHIKKFKG